MDKYVTRAPTWKTKSYAPAAANVVGRYSMGAAKKATEKKSLTQPLTTSGSNINANINVRGRLSMRDEKLLQLFNAPPDQPLVVAATSNGGEGNNYLGELSDYINVPQPGKQQQQHSRPNGAQSPAITAAEAATITTRAVHFTDELQLEQECSSLSNAVATSPVRRLQWMKLPAPSVDSALPSGNTACTPPKQNPALMARIQRDLNSPSATVRMRAIKAMKSPTKSAYTLFDVPHAEQSIISAEERRTPPPAPTIQELMRDIVVYVEVRTGEDNRSTGVKKVISALGARVNDKFLRDTTHVIFKDGLLSTYKKAMNWNIPVVSILWIEACKTQRRICDPKEFPISNVDRYVNPELYDKLKRHKYMQPDSECNKRVRAKPGTPKDATPKTADGTLKKTSTMIGGTPTSANKKTDISHFFKRLGSAKKTPKAVPSNAAVAVISTPPLSATPANGVNMVAESPATLLLNRMSSNCYTPVTDVLIKTKTPALAPPQATAHDEDSGSASVPKSRDVKKSLNFISAKAPIKDPNDVAALTTPSRVTTRRRSSMLKSNLDEATVSIGEMSLSQTPNSPTVRRTTRRRSSMHAQTNMNIHCDVSFRKQNDLTAIAENKQTTTTSGGDDEVRKSTMMLTTTTLPKRTARRRTTYTCKTIDISDVSTTVEKEKKPNVTSRRRTLYTPRKMEESLAAAAPDSDMTTPVTTESTVTLVPSELPLPMEEEENPPQPTAAYGIACSTRLNNNDESAISALSDESAFAPVLSKVASSTSLVGVKDSTTSTQSATTSLLEQCVAAAPVFNSERQPGRRRTLFDVSMDIISQRLQNINQSSARRSIAPVRTHAWEDSYEESDAEIESLETPKPKSLTASVMTSRVQESAKVESLTNINALNDGKMASQTATETGESHNKEANIVGPCATPLIKKKRKLFMPNDSLLLLTPPAAVATQPKSSSGTSSSSLVTPESKRRRKVPLSQPRLESKLASRSNSSSAVSIMSTPSDGNGGKRPSRRSTMDFQTVQRTKTTLAAVKLTMAAPKTSAISCSASKSNDHTSAASASALTAAPAAAVPGARKKLPFLVYTNMHKEQVEVIRETIKTLGGFQLEYSISEATTHVVSLEPRRTLNLLRALARGLWILDYNWILASVRSGRWLSEEHYELRDFSRAVEICRAERQAFGNIYKCELFSGLGSFYISSRCGPISNDNLKELIMLCGGRITEQRKRAKYILGDVNRALEEKVYITPFWILDSITQMQLQPLKKYSTAENVPAATQPKASVVYASQPRVQKALQQVRHELV